MRKEVESWLLQAKDDLEKAEILFAAGKFDGTAFYCQQAVEKALKGLFISKKSKSPGQTHSLIYLANEVRAPRPYYDLLQSLTPEFVTTRYPDVVGEVPYKLYSKQKVAEYLKRAKELIAWAESQMQKQ